MPEGLRVLLVESNQDVLDVMTMDLEDLGLQPTGVTSVSEALRCLASQPFDLVLASVQHPSCKGFELLGELKDRKIQCPFIGTYSLWHASRSLTQAALGQGALAVLKQPFEATQLAAVLQDAGLSFTCNRSMSEMCKDHGARGSERARA